MKAAQADRTHSDALPYEVWASEALTRAAGVPLVGGNRVRLLKDAEQNYPAWIAAIESARRWIHFETYIFHECAVGRQFAELLASKAREGVRVRLIYDWIGSLGYASRRFWRAMISAGVDVRCFNSPGLENPFAWINRDHRKMIAVDGRIAFVTGLCVGQNWIGFPDRHIDPWRDTGIEVVGPAVAQIEHAFADSWAAAGNPLPAVETCSRDDLLPAGDVPVRVVAAVPNVGVMYRLDQLIATLARRSIWISDAYFVSSTSYVQALCAAARSGVDVRLLLPGANDMPVMRAFARAGLRPLLEAGVRVFEWQGSMMHAKTAVADGRWSRVGSTNLNITSWLNNRELDVLVEDEAFGRRMEAAYLADLSKSVEIVLETVHHRPVVNEASSRNRRRRRARTGARTAAGVMRLGQAFGAAFATRKELGPAELVIIFWGAIFLLVTGISAAWWPRSVAYPAAVLCIWTSASLLLRAYGLRRKAKTRRLGKGSI